MTALATMRHERASPLTAFPPNEGGPRVGKGRKMRGDCEIVAVREAWAQEVRAAGLTVFGVDQSADLRTVPRDVVSRTSPNTMAPISRASPSKTPSDQTTPAFASGAGALGGIGFTMSLFIAGAIMLRPRSQSFLPH